MGIGGTYHALSDADITALIIWLHSEIYKFYAIKLSIECRLFIYKNASMHFSLKNKEKQFNFDAVRSEEPRRI